MSKGLAAVLAAAVGLGLAGCGERPDPSSAGGARTSEAVVTAAATGLSWLRCALGQQWQAGHCAGEARMLSQFDAQQRIEGLNAERHQGIDRWRLPSIVELAGLRRCDHGLTQDTFTLDLMAEQAPVVLPRWCAQDTSIPTIDTTRFPDTPAVKFWSHSGSERQQTAYAVNFGNAWIGMNEDSESLYAVRPVADPAPQR